MITLHHQRDGRRH